jgi:glycosyltransferase involved in cell wall biosynthesis
MISLIIPTINRTDELKRLLQSIVNTKEKNIEIIVVDQNKNGLIDSTIYDFSNLLNINHLDVDFSGVSKARNYGIKYAHSEYVLFPDDDCEFFDNSFDIIYDELEKHDVDVLCGRSVDRDFSDSVAVFEKKPAFITLKKHDKMFVEFAMAMRRSIFDVFQFDESIGPGTFYGSGEGYDLVLRMLHGNIRMFYTPDFVLYHPKKVVFYSIQNEIKRSFYYSAGFAYVCKKHLLNSKYYSRLVKVLLFIPYCFLFKRFKVKFYLAELSGLIAGKIV